MVSVFKNVGDMAAVKTTVFLSLVSNVFEKVVNNRLLIIDRYVTFFLISAMALDLLDQLQIFLQLYLIKLLELLAGLGLL